MTFFLFGRRPLEGQGSDVADLSHVTQGKEGDDDHSAVPNPESANPVGWLVGLVGWVGWLVG